MFRNLPNKLDWMTLKGLLDEACFGTFDFLYLRIDFKTSCNVGYAFINFSDVTGMITMLDRVESCGWTSLTADFKTSCNVGYAFINFSDVKGMIAILDRVEHCGWTPLTTPSSTSRTSLA
ncbi:hypothetical protein BU26DRAFT_570688 [Trematosphaeria pertusa]|uniref:Mei2-like C-terminal RNA recognition motif domain-containing protein n=1 Tax=Trematosphaeria pertusa TaxID=390896 RepID=A0A6A6HX54_9PLEO|nr:uncharacterized protein BU26DRAFT_570688 [Trematosphaeria pertusa]KAF2242617.1 hypothetical protein BU26DRAFT_570688 [Trematosphaeria pertusa]